MAKQKQNTRTVEVTEGQANAVQALLTLLGNGQGATPTVVAEATQTTEPEPEPEKPAHEALLEERGGTFVRGRAYVTAEGVKALARVAKTGKPEIVDSPEGNGDAVLAFATEQGNVALQNVKLA